MPPCAGLATLCEAKVNKMSWLKKRREYWRPGNHKLSKSLPRLSMLVTLVVVLVVFISALGTLTHTLYKNMDRSLTVSAQFVAQNYNNPQAVGTIDALQSDSDDSIAQATTQVEEIDPDQVIQRYMMGPKRKDGPRKGRTAPDTLWARGSLAQTIHLIIDEDEVLAGRLTRDLDVEPLTRAQAVALMKHAKTVPSTIDIPNLGYYRVVHVGAKDTQGKHIDVIVGIPTQQSRATLLNFIGWGIVFICVGMAIAWAVTRFLVRRELAALDQVTQTAQAISSADLQTQTKLPARVDGALVAGDSESAQVGKALNTALDHIEVSLAKRSESEQKLRQFVADASHELRTPIATISGYAQLLEGSVRAQNRVSASRIHSEAERMAAMVEDLLLLARLDEGRQLEKTPVDVARIVVDCVADAHVSYPEHQWEAEIPPQQLLVMGDAMKLQQMLGNLLTNAAHHTPSGTKIVVSARWTPQGVELVVCDNGPGIPEELKPHIFDRFTRGDQARTPGESSGLGLSIVAALVRAHGGTITVSDTPNGGATFTVCLPPIPGDECVPRDGEVPPSDTDKRG